MGRYRRRALSVDANHRGTGSRHSVQRVRALLRPFILAVHPDRHHSAPSDVRALNEDSLKRLNGFLDLAEAQSTPGVRPTLGNRSEPAYSFAFGGIFTDDDDDDDSGGGRVSATVSVPAELRGGGDSGGGGDKGPVLAVNTRKQWTHLTARCAVDLMEDAGMEVPEELCSLLAETTMHTAAAAAAAAPAPDRKLRTSPSAANDETGLTRAQVLRMTLDHIEDAEFEPIGANKKKKGQSAAAAVAAAQAAAGAHSPEVARQLFVQALFESQRVTVGSGMEESPGAVMRGAQRLREVLLEHSEELGLDNPRWLFVLFELSSPKLGTEVNTFRHEEVVFVRVPCEQEVEEEREAVAEHARRRALLHALQEIAQRDP